MNAALMQADALRIPLADESVDLIITSPPYFALRSYRDGDEHYDGQIGSEATPQAFLEALWAVTAECWRVLKPSGSLWVNLGDKYAGSGGHNNAGLAKAHTGSLTGGHRTLVGAPADIATRRNAPNRYNKNSNGIRAKSLLGLPWRYAIGCIDGLAAPDGQRWILRAEVVWSKPNGLPESVTDRVRRSHEQWFHMVKNPRYFAAVDEVREPHIYPDDNRHERGPRVAKGDGNVIGWHDKGNTSNGNSLGKLPGSVWNIPSEPLIIPPAIQRHYDLPDHFAAFPQEWPRRIILGWSPNGVCVECGEGRRPVVAKEYALRQKTYNPDKRVSPEGMTGNGGWNRLFADGMKRLEATITGYECACCERDIKRMETDARYDPQFAPPTTPAVVLDPFCGTGTVPMVARALGRLGVGIDLSADYLRLARWRITSGHAAKAVQRTHRENQGGLFANVDVKGEVL